MKVVASGFVIGLGVLGAGCASGGPAVPVHAPAPVLAPATAAGTPAPTELVIENGFGDEAAWVRGFLERAAADLVRRMDAPDVAPPARIEVTLTRDPDAGYLGGGSTPTALTFVSDQWPREPQRLWILTHELVNLFAAHYAGHGGFPSDWWSDGRSPFPRYVATLVLSDLGEEDAARWVRGEGADEPDYRLYWALDERYGFALFARALALLRADDVDLGEIAPPWPWPNGVRSAYTIAYLSLAAGEDLTATALSFGVGGKPSDWDQNHFEIPFEEYTVTAGEVAGIQRARAQAFARGAPDAARALYRGGEWREALAAAGGG